MKIAFIFPGQGSQEVGMGRDLLGKDARADALMNTASTLTGEDLSKLCTRGPDRRLSETRYLQPALTALSLALLERLVQACNDVNITPTATAGHSIGELPACVAAGILDPIDCIKLAVKRGAAMSDAAKIAPGKMIAITGPSSKDTLELIKQHRGPISAATVNAPSQITVSGPSDALDQFKKQFIEQSNATITKLRVEGAWHSKSMESALPPFVAALKETTFYSPSTTMIFNRHGQSAQDPDQIRTLLAGQLTRPVRWDLVMKELNNQGITDYIEIGPGRVLKGLARLNLTNPSIRLHSANDIRSIKTTVKNLSII